MTDVLEFEIPLDTPNGATVHCKIGEQITAADKKQLGLLAKEARLVIEVGTFIGSSARAMLSAMSPDGRLVCVDTFAGTPNTFTAQVPGKLAYLCARQQLQEFGDRAIVVTAASQEAARLVATGISDLVFIDAAHDYKSVMADIKDWLRALRPGGIMAGHDFSDDSLKYPEAERSARSTTDTGTDDNLHHGVTRAVLESFRRFDRSTLADSTIWWAQKEWAA